MSILLLLSFLISLNAGASEISLWDTALDIVHGKSSEAVVILWDIRMPRSLLAVFLGASLGLAGASMQGLLRNPLAEPGVLGVNGGAVLGAVLVIYSGLASSFSLALPLGGMAGAFLTVLILYLFAGYMASVQTLILAGIAINTLAFAGTSLVLNLSKDPYAALEIVFWQMGSLTDRSFDHLTLVAPFVLLGCLLLLWDGRALNALSLGEEAAMSLGIPIQRVRFRIILGTALAVGGVTAVCGSVVFVGLMVPHLFRPLVKHEPGKLLGISAVGGAVLVLWADLFVRYFSVGTELKLGVLTSLIGAPFFLALIFKMRRNVS
ncbi:MAG: iron ABC transporter permease [Candidatus Omnitrophica bacterium]|nr:iron ABC transporter permease [Candidatus Omnitrophota bacterium]